jgi:hypothetical protein
MEILSQFVIPANAGTQSGERCARLFFSLGSRVRGNDEGNYLA